MRGALCTWACVTARSPNDQWEISRRLSSVTWLTWQAHKTIFARRMKRTSHEESETISFHRAKVQLQQRWDAGWLKGFLTSFHRFLHRVCVLTVSSDVPEVLSLLRISCRFCFSHHFFRSFLLFRRLAHTQLSLSLQFTYGVVIRVNYVGTWKTDTTGTLLESGWNIMSIDG